MDSVLVMRSFGDDGIKDDERYRHNRVALGKRPTQESEAFTKL